MKLLSIVRQTPKWIRTIAGRSVLTLPQGVGRVIEKDGYYNDLTCKVIGSTLIDNAGIPYNLLTTGEIIQMPVTIIQYGLGLFDMYLLENDSKYIDLLKPVCEWLINYQHNNGGWGIDLLDKTAPEYSAMAQGEAISLLVRIKGRFEDKDEEISKAIYKAYKLLITPVEEGGVSRFSGDCIYLYENTRSSPILNGSIFALWGLYDYANYSGDPNSNRYFRIAAQTISNNLPKYDNGYWSEYKEGNIASQFYHNLHIAQLSVLKLMLPDLSFEEYYNKWATYRKSKINRWRAFFVKAFQKIRSKDNVSVIK